jgi:hypothetical protein
MASTDKEFAMTTARKGAVSVAAASLLASIAGGGVAVAGHPGSAEADGDHAGRRTLLLTLPFNGGRNHFIDLGRHGISIGDEFTSVDTPIRAEKTGQLVASADGMETILDGHHDGTVQQELTFRFAGGTVTVGGEIRHTDTPIRLGVTGGTGRYDRARGQLVLLREDAQRKVTVMRLELR